MATVNKDFKVKNGLIVEGTTAKVNNFDILTKKQADQDYIVGLIGGTATSANTPDTVVKRDANGDFAAREISADLIGDVLGQVSDISNHDTDDLTEGSINQYFTAQRVKNVLTGSTQTNISITEVGGDLHIAAENGVDDSTTDDLEEGTTNKYFTDVRAVDALEAVVPDFTAVEINTLAKQVASTVSVATAGQVTAYEFLGTEYRSAKFLVKTAQGSHTDVAEVLLTMDSSNNISITEYAMVGTNGSLMTITADYVEIGTTVRLRVTTANNTSVVTVVGTLLA
jgi:hypothetical protein